MPPLPPQLSGVVYDFDILGVHYGTTRKALRNALNSEEQVRGAERAQGKGARGHSEGSAGGTRGARDM